MLKSFKKQQKQHLYWFKKKPGFFSTISGIFEKNLKPGSFRDFFKDLTGRTTKKWLATLGSQQKNTNRAMADVNLASSSDVVIESRDSIETGNEAFEPASKKQRKEENNVEKTKNADERLETRLGGILCCSVCLDLPSSAVYQVSYFLHKVIISTFTQNGCTFLMLNILWSVIQWGNIICIPGTTYLSYCLSWCSKPYFFVLFGLPQGHSYFVTLPWAPFTWFRLNILAVY